MVAAAVIVVTLQDWRDNRSLQVVRSETPNATETGEVQALALGAAVTPADLRPAIGFVQGENDCADFRLITLLRLAYSNPLSAEVEASLRDLFVGFRYQMDEPGVNAMVYWSENHQILFAAAELLAGQRHPDLRFRDGRTGAQHRDDAREQVLFWLEQRWRFGFSEWNSHYYTEDLAALGALIDFAQDEEVARKATILTDLLMFDLASLSLRGTFIATSGRLYQTNKQHGDAAVDRIVHQVLLGEPASGGAGLEINLLASRYRAPAVLQAIARDEQDVVLESSTGRDLDELAADPSLDTEERRILALWGMQAFTNPEAIAPSLRWIRAHGLLSNASLSPFRRLNYRAPLWLGLLPEVSRGLDLPTNGMVLGRADTYALRTRDFVISTTLSHRPGGFGNQQNIFAVTLDPGVTLFHTHPAALPGDPPPNGNSPGYWTGSGFLPLSCQEGPVNLSVYRLPGSPGFGRTYLLEYTHLYAPLSRFSRVALDGAQLVAQYGDALVAVTAGSALARAGDDELIQSGRETAWVTELSSARTESFEAFQARVRATPFGFDGETLRYGTRTISWRLGCAVPGAPRHHSRYARIQREPTEVRIEHGGHGLVLDFAAMRRESW